jgi:hypothetical protein
MGKGKRVADAPVETGEGASSNKRPKRIATLSEKGKENRWKCRE